MAKTLFELAQEYLNRGMPDISQTPRVITPPAQDPSPVIDPSDPNAVQRVLQLGSPNNGGENNSNSIRSSNGYSPYSYRQAAAKSGVGIPSGILSNSSFFILHKVK